MRVAIAGLGLIGGSLALALRDRHGVRGFDSDPAAREAAASAGADVVAALPDLVPADVVVVATPLEAVVPTIAALEAGGAVVPILDVSSVRAPVDRYARASPGTARLVGMHPMAGRTDRGFAAAERSLFAGRPFLIVPTVRADAAAMAVAGAIARDAGGVVTVCSGSEHDRIVAYLSALPLALAAALAIAADDAIGEGVPGLAGPGFRDATRLAGTSAELGLAMLSENAANVAEALAAVGSVVDALEHAASGDTAGLQRALARAYAIRRRLG